MRFRDPRFGHVDSPSFRQGEHEPPVPVWSPLDLGDDLLGWWSADAAQMTLDAGAISEWRDKKAGYIMSPSPTKPMFSPTGWGGSKPAVLANGVDNYFFCTDPVFLASLPAGTNAGELWGLVRQDALVGDTTERVVMSYGAGSAFNNARRITRIILTAANRARIMVGTGATALTANNTEVDFAGQHVVRGQFGPTESILSIDDSETAPLAAVPSTNVTKAVIFASSGTAPVSPWNGAGRDFLFTRPLDEDQETALKAFIAERRAA